MCECVRACKLLLEWSTFGLEPRFTQAGEGSEVRGHRARRLDEQMGYLVESAKPVVLRLT